MADVMKGDITYRSRGLFYANPFLLKNSCGTN